MGFWGMVWCLSSFWVEFCWDEAHFVFSGGDNRSDGGGGREVDSVLFVAGVGGVRGVFVFRCVGSVCGVF